MIDSIDTSLLRIFISFGKLGERLFKATRWLTRKRFDVRFESVDLSKISDE